MHKFSQIRKLYQRLRFSTFIRLILIKLVNRILNREQIPCFSQFGEDRIIENLINTRDGGNYVEIGSNHPINFSNTWSLYLKGWKGVCIDANSDLIELHKSIRLEDIAVPAVISDQIGEVEFYSSKVSHLISGVGSLESKHWPRNKENCNVVARQAVRLADLLSDLNFPSDFELLCIDVEGHELEVLRTVDFLKYRPKVVLVEIHDFEIFSCEANPIYQFLKAHHYHVCAFSKPNVFFAAS